MTMTIAKDQRFDKLGTDRHELELKLDKKLIHDKSDEIKVIKHAREQVKAKFESNIDLQNCFMDEQNLREGIEESHIKLSYLNVLIKQHESDSEMFVEEKDTLLI